VRPGLLTVSVNTTLATALSPTRTVANGDDSRRSLDWMSKEKGLALTTSSDTPLFATADLANNLKPIIIIENKQIKSSFNKT
jgi:hypothetical protein